MIRELYVEIKIILFLINFFINDYSLAFFALTPLAATFLYLPPDEYFCFYLK